MPIFQYLLHYQLLLLLTMIQQLLKALFPMLSTLSGIITSLTEVLLPKAPSPMAVTVFGIQHS